MKLGSVPPERITKIDAARRQLRTAIRLFFEDQDAVSIHTLAGAAHEVLRDLLIGTSPRSFIKDTDIIKPGHEKEYWAAVNKARNFFKHADNDPTEVLQFHAEFNPLWILDAVEMYKRYVGRLLHDGYIFINWFVLTYPDIVRPGPTADEAKRMRARIGRPVTKQDFLPLLNQPGNTD